MLVSRIVVVYQVMLSGPQRAGGGPFSDGVVPGPTGSTPGVFSFPGAYGGPGAQYLSNLMAGVMTCGGTGSGDLGTVPYSQALNIPNAVLRMSWMNGVATPVWGSAAGTIPDEAQFVVVSPNASLPNAVALNALTAGVLQWNGTSLITQPVNLTSQVSGVLPIANGGTNNATQNAGGVCWVAADGSKINSLVGPSGYSLESLGATGVQWVDRTPNITLVAFVTLTSANIASLMPSPGLTLVPASADGSRVPVIDFLNFSTLGSTVALAGTGALAVFAYCSSGPQTGTSLTFVSNGQMTSGNPLNLNTGNLANSSGFGAGWNGTNITWQVYGFTPSNASSWDGSMTVAAYYRYVRCYAS